MSLTAARTNFANMTPLVTKIGRPTLHGVTFFNGALVALDGATRYLKPNTGAAGDIIKGCADLKQHPTVTSHASTDGGITSNGTTTIDVITGIFPFAIGSAGDALSATDVGSDVYGIDDTTVGKTDGGTGRPVAGELVRLETLGGVSIAWVAVGMSLGRTSAGSVGAGTTDSVSAAGAISNGTRITELTVVGTKAYTIGAPLFVGQQKTVVCIAASGTPVATLTSAGNTNGWTTVSGLGALGATINLIANASLKWDIAGGLTVTVA